MFLPLTSGCAWISWKSFNLLWKPFPWFPLSGLIGPVIQFAFAVLAAVLEVVRQGRFGSTADRRSTARDNVASGRSFTSVANVKPLGGLGVAIAPLPSPVTLSTRNGNDGLYPRAG